MPEVPEPPPGDASIGASGVSLDGVTAALGIAPHEVQAFDPAHPDFDAQRPLLVLRGQMEAARLQVRRRYRPDLSVRVVSGGVASSTAVATLPLNAEAWLLPALPPEEDRRSLAGLRGVMERLFGPEGCPWDREQTHETLRPYLIEETYELVDAIDRGDTSGLREEVGDVLAHMFMQTAIAQSAGSFSLEDAVEYANEKFVRRHPHVFGEEQVDSPEALLGKWEQIKAQERADRGEEATPDGALDSTPTAAPSLQRAQVLIRRASRSGLPPSPVEPRAMLTAALAREDWAAALWALALLAGDGGFDAEETLREAASRFTRAFRELEDEARRAGVEVADLPTERRMAPWHAVSPALTEG